MDTKEKLRVGVVVLAGGRATRMGGNDKGLLRIGDKTLLETCLAKVDQAETVCVSANRNLQAYRSIVENVFEDRIGGYTGPLAGVHSAIHHLSGAVDAVISIPCDSPFFPKDLVQNLSQLLAANPHCLCAAVKAEGKCEPGFAIYRVQLLEQLETYLTAGGRRVRQFLESNNVLWCEYEDARAFRNLNTPEELAASQPDVV